MKHRMSLLLLVSLVAACSPGKSLSPTPAPAPTESTPVSFIQLPTSTTRPTPTQTPATLAQPTSTSAPDRTLAETGSRPSTSLPPAATPQPSVVPTPTLTSTPTPASASEPFEHLFENVLRRVTVVDAHDGYAYVNVGAILVILDVSDRHSPHPVGALALPVQAIVGISVAEGYAYVSAAEDGLRIVNVADPAHPLEVSSYQPPLISGATWEGTRSGPEAPGYLYYQGVRAVAVSRSGDRAYAYVAAQGAGLRVLDVSDPARPVEVGTLATAGGVVDVAIAHDRAYLAVTGVGVQIVDISEPGAPRASGAAPLAYPEVWSVAVAADRPESPYVYAALGMCHELVGCRGAFEVVDVTNAAAPQTFSSGHPLFSAQVAVSRRHAYLLTDGLRVWDVSEPRQPQETASLPSWAMDMALADDTLYLASADDGLQILDLTDPEAPRLAGQWHPSQRLRQRWQHYLADTQVESMAISPAGEVWVGTIQGVRVFDGQAWTEHLVPQDENYNIIQDIAFDRLGQTWVTDLFHGTQVFDGQSWRTFAPADGRVGLLNGALEIDATGRLWFGTEQEGVAVFDGQSWHTYTTADGLMDNAISAMAIDRSGQVWVGTMQGASKFDGQGWTSYTSADGLAGSQVLTIAVDDADRKWFGTPEGVSVFDGQQWRTYTDAHGTPIGGVLAIGFDQSGRVWLGARGVLILDGQRFVHYTTADGLPGDYVSAIATDAAGNIWIGGSGVSRFRPD